MIDIGRDLQRAYDEGYKQGRYDEKVEAETSLPNGEQTHALRTETHACDLIKRQDAIDALKEHRALYCDNTPDSFSKLSYAEKSRVDELDTAIATLVNLPSAQPERKKGKWINRSLNILYPAFERYTCSVCGKHSYSYDFCPNCGSYNGGESDDKG